MSELRELAAGVVCGGFDGSHVTPELRQFVKEVPLAGFVVFGRNVRSLPQVRELTDQFREIIGSPVLAVDQEGGRVARIREGVEEIPSALAIAAASGGEDELAFRAGSQVAFDLRRAGLNLDFAPVLDLALEPMNTVIGTRSFGDDPRSIARLGGVFARGLQDGGVVATFKHFPGHGSTEVDSHLDLPVIDAPETLLRSRDLLPFATLLPGARAVMTAHIVTRAFDSNEPATLSPRILTGLLRDELRFSGVCFTDCLQMDAIAKRTGSERAAVKALAAGADCVLISHDLELARRSVEAIERAVQDGTLARDRLQEASERMRRLRASLQPPLPLDSRAPFAGIGRKIGARAVTVIRGNAQAGERNSVISFESATVEGAQGAHDRHTPLSAFHGLREVILPLDPSEDRVEEAVRETGSGAPIVLMRRAHVYPRQKAAIDRILAARPDALLVSLREPFDAFEFPSARDVLCTYGDDAPSIAGLADVLFGGRRPQGTFPLHGAPIARN